MGVYEVRPPGKLRGGLIIVHGAFGPNAHVDALGERFAAYGWHVQHIDGHDVAEIADATNNALADPRPSLISCKTIIGFGSPKLAGTSEAHSNAFGPEELKATRAALPSWCSAPGSPE